MRARLVFTAVLAVLALLTTGAGAALAQGGLDDSDSAAGQQYGTTQERGVIGEIDTVEPAPDAAPAPPAAQAQPAAPVQQAEGNLPFTGFATLGVVLLGIALLGAGLVLRRTTRRGAELSG